MKFSIYNIQIDQLICDPIPYSQQRFADIINRAGGDGRLLPMRLSKVLKLGALWIVPGREVKSKAPAPFGYIYQLGPWQLVGDELIRTIYWQPMPLADAANQLRE